jgi:hypothetical protein
VKESPIEKGSDQSPDENQILFNSVNFGFIPKCEPAKRNFEQIASRRESKVISDMKYNIARAESQSVYKMVAAKPFTKKLTNLEISHFLRWYTEWNDHMVASKTFTEPTNLVSSSVREILCESNSLSMEDFHVLDADDFIYLICKEIKIYSKMEFYDKMMESYGAMPKIAFHENQGVTGQAQFYNGLLARKNYFRKCLELLSIQSAKFIPEMKGEYGLVKVFTSAMDLHYVQLMQAEIGRINEYTSITEYITAFCELAKQHLEIAKVYSRSPFASNKMAAVSTTAPISPDRHTHERHPQEDSDCDRSGTRPKHLWEDRLASRTVDEDTDDAAEGRDVHSWVETVPRRYGQHEHHTEQDSSDDEVC